MSYQSNYSSHFAALPPESKGGVVVHPSRIDHKFYLLLSSEIAKLSRELSLPFGVATHLNITLLSVYVIKSSLVRQLVSNCMHVLSLALLSGLWLLFGFLQVTYLSA